MSNRRSKSNQSFTKDVELLRYLYIVKAATVEQAKRDVYKSPTLKTVQNKLSRFRSEDLVSYTLGSNDDQFKAYFLTECGYKCVFNTSSPKNIKLKSDSIDHDLTLNDIRSKILDSKDVKEFWTENQLKEAAEANFKSELSIFSKLNADGAFRVSFPNGNFLVSLEYEHSWKNKTRYDEFISSY